MRLRYILITLAVIIGGLLSTNCGGIRSSSSYAAISPQPTSLPVNSVTTFTVTNASNGATWQFVPNLPGIPGTLSTTTGDTTTYTAPATPPVYPNELDYTRQGVVFLLATVTGNNVTSVSIPITAPSVTTGISPATASVALGATQQFYGYAVGSTNNALSFQVNGVTGAPPPPARSPTSASTPLPSTCRCPAARSTSPSSPSPTSPRPPPPSSPFTDRPGRAKPSSSPDTRRSIDPVTQPSPPRAPLTT